VTRRWRYVSKSFHGSKRDAEHTLAALLMEVRSGAGRGTDATMATLIEEWLDLRKDSLSVTTWAGYVRKARSRLIPAVGEVPVRKLTVRQIDTFYRVLSRDEGLSGSTVHQIHNVLTGALDQAVRWGWRSDNPARLATLPPARDREIVPPTPQEVRRVIQSAGDEFAVFLRIAAAIGVRRGEISALRWQSVDLDRGEITITRALVESYDKEILEKDTKTHQSRRVALDAGTADALRAWRQIVEKRAADCGSRINPDSFVFSPEPNGSSPWNPMHWTSAWRRLREKTGINENLRLHDLRHFSATRLLNAGVPVRTVSGRLGHARAATTLNVYSHFVPSSDRVAADAMETILDGESADGSGLDRSR
jgi:integrase